jgi:MFS superfamily sulfate permease-like transporter
MLVRLSLSLSPSVCYLSSSLPKSFLQCGCVIISVLRILHVGSSAFAALAGCMAGAAGFFMIGAFAVFFGFTRHAYEDDNVRFAYYESRLVSAILPNCICLTITQEWPFEPEVDYASVLVCIGGFFACLSGGVYAYKYKN